MNHKLSFKTNNQILTLTETKTCLTDSIIIINKHKSYTILKSEPIQKEFELSPYPINNITYSISNTKNLIKIFINNIK